MANESPEKPAQKGTSKESAQESSQKPKPAATGKKSARAKKPPAKTKTTPKTAKTKSKVKKTKPTGDAAESQPKSPAPKRKPAAAETKKTSPSTRRKVDTGEDRKPFLSADTSVVPPITSEEPDTMNKMLLYGSGILALFVFLIVAASLQNMGKYEIIDKNGVVEVWKGRFSPLGRDLMISMPGVKPPGQQKAVYTREDVYPMVFQYYLSKTDALLAAKGSPGFEEIKASLKQAGSFALTAEDRSLVDSRLKAIDRTVLIFKADVAAAEGTAEGLQTARVYLNKAAALNPDDIEARLIQQKLESVQKQMQAMRPGLANQPEKPQAQEKKVPPPAPEADDHGAPEADPSDKTSAPIGRGTT